MTAGFDVEPLDGTFGARIHGIELRSIDDATFAELHETWLEFALLVFSGQHLTTDEQNDFARRFGDLEFEATAISNISLSGRVHHEPDSDLVKSLRGNEGWHFDSTYMPVQAKGAVFSAEIVPTEGAATGWADMRAAFDALDDTTKDQLGAMEAHHSLYYSQGRAGYLPSKRNDDGTYGLYGYHDLDTPRRPLVKVHPDTGRANLLIGRHAHDIVGMAPEASESFLDKLNAEACHPSRTYHHSWEVGDAVVWDNRRLMHRATPYDMTEPRRMWHTRIAGADSERALNHQ